MAENIVLVGMMGVGKTAVGRLLAEELAFDFVDLDAELEQVTGLKLPEIYRKYGQIRFYSEDKLLLGKQLGKSSQVFAADGALPPQAEHLRLWRQMGCVVWLQAEAETVFRRMRRKKNRLFLPKQASVETVQQMMAEREPLYAETADFAVNVDKWALEQVAAKLDEGELLGLIKLYQGKADRLLKPRVQLSYGGEDVPREIADGAFLI